jgi:hypothetical protein
VPQVPALVHLVRKLQGILAAIERLPVQSCVGPNTLAGLEALKRPLRLQLQVPAPTKLASSSPLLLSSRELSDTKVYEP